MEPFTRDPKVHKKIKQKDLREYKEDLVDFRTSKKILNQVYGEGDSTTKTTVTMLLNMNESRRYQKPNTEIKREWC